MESHKTRRAATVRERHELPPVPIVPHPSRDRKGAIRSTCDPAALWGSQSWLPPAFSRRLATVTHAA
jgi:hypothetical protein